MCFTDGQDFNDGRLSLHEDLALAGGLHRPVESAGFMGGVVNFYDFHHLRGREGWSMYESFNV